MKKLGKLFTSTPNGYIIELRGTQRRNTDMTYRISRYNPDTKDWEDFGGGYTEEDVKVITKGFKNNGLFYERKNSRVMYEVIAD